MAVSFSTDNVYGYQENAVLTVVSAQMEAFKQCWKRRGNDERTDAKGA
jgi:hypothetical protein